MNTSSTLIATAKIRPGEEAAFTAWQVKHNEVISKFPGLISSDIMPPGAGAGSNEWTIVLNFQTPDQLRIWQSSSERADLIAGAMPFLDGGNLGEIMTSGPEAPNTNVSEVVLSKIKPGMDDQYRAWAVRIQHAQSKYPGYRGMYPQPPTDAANGRWTTLVRYDSAEHLEEWMKAPERAELLEESKAFIESEELTRLATAFPGWVPIDPNTGEGPPNWKTAMLVLLGLFPIVLLSIRFLNPHLTALNPAVATLLANSLSVALTTWGTMPLFIRMFGWWLFVKPDSAKGTTLKGSLIIVALYAAEVAALWHIFS